MKLIVNRRILTEGYMNFLKKIKWYRCFIFQNNDLKESV